MVKPIPYETKVRNENENALKRLKALENARDRLKREGFEFPVINSSITTGDFYEAVRIYGELESRYMLEYLKMPSGPRPVIEYKKEEYKPYKDD